MADAGPSYARRTAWISFLAGLAMFGADRLHKYIQIDMFGWAGGEHVRVLPFFDYMYVRNFGVSYGLLSGMPWYVIATIIALAMALLIGWWIKATSLRLRLALALCLGGAASNAADRVLYGSVADFFYLHAGDWSFYVFNLADVAITAGALLLIADLIFARPPQKKA